MLLRVKSRKQFVTKALQVSGSRTGVPTRVWGRSASTAGGNTGAEAGGRKQDKYNKQMRYDRHENCGIFQI